MIKNITFSFLLFVISLGCIQQTSNESRQFENKVEPQVLLSGGENIVLPLRYWYQFRSNTEEPFNELGYFIEEDSNIDAIAQAIVYASARELIKKYTSKELYEIERNSLEEELYAIAKSNATSLDNSLEIQFNTFILGEISFPHIIQKVKKVNLLSEFDALKSTDVNVRILAIKKLLKEGSEESYAIVLEHWVTEKNEKARNYILETLASKNRSNAN